MEEGAMTTKPTSFDALRGAGLRARKPRSGSPVRWDLALVPVAILSASLALSPAARAFGPAHDKSDTHANTAEGTDALDSLTTGDSNTATGFDALFANTTGDHNTATGTDALVANTIGRYNTATGNQTLQNNTTGNNNVPTGGEALLSNTIGSNGHRRISAFCQH
jgi:hypothetical protein